MKKLMICAVLVALVAFSTSCARFEDRIQTEIIPENELFAMGMEKFNSKDWDAAIIIFDRFERLYVNSERIQEIRLNRADAHFNKNRTTSLILAKSEYQSFLALYPRYEREDYIWLQIARCSVNQMLPPNRDQAPTKQAIEDIETYLERYPNSSYVPEARELLNEAYTNLAEYHVIVGGHYFARGMHPAASQRFKSAIQQKVDLKDMESIYYRVVISMARAASNYTALHDYISRSEQEQLIGHYRDLHESSVYDANFYLEEYKRLFPSNANKISEMQGEINMITAPREIEPTAETEEG